MSIEKIKNDTVYKQIIKDSFGGVLYNVANKYKGDHLLKLWDEMSPGERENAGGIVKGAVVYLKEQDNPGGIT